MRIGNGDDFVVDGFDVNEKVIHLNDFAFIMIVFVQYFYVIAQLYRMVEKYQNARCDV